jgi:hypothetical protein
LNNFIFILFFSLLDYQNWIFQALWAYFGRVDLPIQVMQLPKTAIPGIRFLNP